MQQASAGLRSALGRAANAISGKTTIVNRSFHPPQLPHTAPPAPSTTAQRTVRTARDLASRFFQHLATPGVGSVPATGPGFAGARGFHAASRPTIQQGFSLPVRNALLNKALGAPHLPRAPAVPRSVTQVGLGTARAFHSGRPIFESLANVPIVARALCEADLDVQKRAFHAKAALTTPKANVEATQKGKGPRAKENVRVQPVPVVAKAAPETEELDVYFPVAPAAPVTTTLTIPLAPTPSGRTPLPSSGSSSADRLLPLFALASIHALHRTHGARVSSLFARLDDARVWDDPHVRRYSFGAPDGTCTLLEVVFEGWDEARVRAVLGDAGRGWCEVRETRSAAGVEDSVLGQHASPAALPANNDGAMSEELDRWFAGLDDNRVSSPLPPRLEVESDPADSVILPTLDFSTPTVDAHETASSLSDEDWDAFSDSALSDGVLSDIGSDDANLYGLSSPRSARSVWTEVRPPSLFTAPMSPHEHQGPMEYLF